MFDLVIGWAGVALGLLVAPTQLWKILKTKQVNGISRATYTFLCLALVCYLIHAINIKDAVFITAQAINILANFTILVLLFGRAYDRRRQL
uniref:PQ loop repeat protein n=1 Tax=viral metagenome TaxID=1070528 RepID=A0A6M3L456_9ZZZZ